MVVTGLGLLLGQRADSGAVRSGAAQASVDGVWIVPEDGPVADRVREAGGDRSSRSATAPPSCSSVARSRARAADARRSAAAPRPQACWPTSPTSSSSCMASPISCGCARPQRSARRSTGSAATTCSRARAEYRAAFEQWRAIERELTELTTDRDARAAEAERLRAQIAEIEQAAPQPGEDAELAVRAERLANAEELRLAAATAHDALSGDGDGPDAGGAPGRGPPRARARARPDPRPNSPGRSPTSAIAPPTSPRRSRATSRISTRPVRTSSPPSRSVARCSPHSSARTARSTRRSRSSTPARRGSRNSTTTAIGSSG